MPLCVRVSRVSRVCPGSPGVFLPVLHVRVPAPPGVFLPVLHDTVLADAVRRCRVPSWRLCSGRPVRALRRRPWSMPTTARANRTDGDAEAGAAEAEKCKKARVTLPVLSVLQTVLQHAAEALADKTKELSDVLGSINNDQLVAEPDVWLQPRPERTTRRTADGSRTAQIASHGRLTACRSRLMRYPDRADDRRASLFLRRGALCILACVVQGILCA